MPDWLAGPDGRELRREIAGLVESNQRRVSGAQIGDPERVRGEQLQAMIVEGSASDEEVARALSMTLRDINDQFAARTSGFTDEVKDTWMQRFVSRSKSNRPDLLGRGGGFEPVE